MGKGGGEREGRNEEERREKQETLAMYQEKVIGGEGLIVSKGPLGECLYKTAHFLSVH